MKLQVHDFTIYRLHDHDVSLYMWRERSGGVTCNEFVSCVTDYISKLPQNVSSVVLISDGCSYQNRNKTMSSSLRDIARLRNIVIEQIILEKGHTMMEADSVHSVLDRMFKTAQIYSPQDYLCLMRQARPKQPYNVVSVDHAFFKNYDDCATNLASVRPGCKPGDATVTDIRAFQYLPSGDIMYKLNHSEEWSELCVLRSSRRNNNASHVGPLYENPLPITAAKYAHLQQMISLMPAEYHDFYRSLPHM